MTHARSLPVRAVSVLFALLAIAALPSATHAQCTVIEGGKLVVRPAAGNTHARLVWKGKDRSNDFLIADPRAGTTTLELLVAGEVVASFAYGTGSAPAWKGAGSPVRAWKYKDRNDPSPVPGIRKIKSARHVFVVKGRDGVIDQIDAPLALPVRLRVTDSAGNCFTTDFRACRSNDSRRIACRWSEPPPLPEVASLVFQSGFEDDTRHVFATGTTAPCTDDLRGEDLSVASAGHWENDLEGGAFGVFGLCFGGGDRDQRAVDLVVDPEDAGNQVLRGRITEPNENVGDDATACNGDPPGARKARIQAVLQDNRPLGRIDYRVRMRLDADTFGALVAADSEITWLTIGELWNNLPAESGSFRVTLNLIKQGVAGEPLEFGLKAEKQDDGASEWQRVWPAAWPGTGVEVPLGQWFTLQVAFVEGDAATGRVVVRMTDPAGTVHDIADVTDWTYSPDGVPDGFRDLHPLKLYTSGTLSCALAALDLPLQIWWDDFAIGSPD